MGLDINGTQFLLFAAAQGVRLEKMAMLGRQELKLGAAPLMKIFQNFGRPIDTAAAEQLLKQNKGYAEPFLQTLGAREIHSFDVAAYEEATDLHDFNFPIPEIYKNSFDAVLDGGSLEHIFNFPGAIQNCMEMLKVGGHFLGITPANNFFGHGFYQFSPELYFRVFNESNGFEIVHLLAFEDVPDTNWYEVSDPEIVRQRVLLRNPDSTYLAIIARKTANVPLFKTPPHQSDYVNQWQGNSSENVRRSTLSSTILPLVKRLLFLPLKKIIRPLRRFIRNDTTYYDSRFFKKRRLH